LKGTQKPAHLFGADRFWQISIHSGSQTFLAITRHGVSCQSNDQLMFTCAKLFAANGRGRLKAIHVRHLKIHEHDIKVVLFERQKRAHSAFDAYDPVAGNLLDCK
jgi:hypothetical protein